MSSKHVLVLDVGFCTKAGRGGVFIHVMLADGVEPQHNSSTVLRIIFKTVLQVTLTGSPH